jgi:hypothetical protein
MFFNIDADEGGVIRGWLALDNPSAIPSLIVVVPGREEIRLQADVIRPDVRDLGVHTTGQVGFEINSAVLPGIDEINDVMIVEAETRMPIFRRFQIERHLEKKLFLFDSSVMPQRSLINSMLHNFTLSYSNSERLSLETMLVVINNHFSHSLAICGRSNFSRYSSFLHNAGYIRAALLREPFEELAERLMFLNLISKSPASALLGIYATGIESLTGFARELPFLDQKALMTAFRSITEEQKQALTSPMTRMFGCNFDEFPERRHVGIALENLASMDVVGTRARFPDFRALLDATLGANVLGKVDPVSFPSIQSFAASLSRIGIVADLLGHDLALYSYVDEAIKIGVDGTDPDQGRDTQTI